MSYRKYYGEMIPDGFNETSAVARFNRGDDAWCGGAACGNLSCGDCVMCVTAWRGPDHRKLLKVAIFAHWAREHGYALTRPGLKEIEERNDNPCRIVTQVDV